MVKTLLYFFSQRTFLRSLVVVTLLGFAGIVLAESGIREDADSLDTVLKKSTPQILSQVGPRLIVDRGGDPFKKNNSIDIQKLKRSQFLSIQQLLKGNMDGVYVQENNGEPGSIQSMLIRGLSSPVFSNKDLSRHILCPADMRSCPHPQSCPASADCTDPSTCRDYIASRISHHSP